MKEDHVPHAYRFHGVPWKHPAAGGWVFVQVPKNISLQIRARHAGDEEGWGRLKTVARVGNTEWNTAIWYDSRLGTYLLPLKGSVRSRERILPGEPVSVEIRFSSTWSIHRAKFS